VTQAYYHTSEEVINLTVALFVVGFGLGPLVLAPVSELVGRKKIYLASMAGMCIFTIPCAVAPNAATLIAFRLVSGLFASAPPTNAAGTIADVWDANSRGMKMAVRRRRRPMSTLALHIAHADQRLPQHRSLLWFCLPPLVSGHRSEVSFSKVAEYSRRAAVGGESELTRAWVSGRTGYMTMYAGWKSMYWLIVAMSGALFFVVLFFYDETYAPTLLGRRAKRLRKETGDPSYATAQERLRRPASEIVFEALARPLLMLTTELIMICFTAYLCLIYALLYGFFFAYPIIFAKGHGFNAGQTGLTFFGILIGIVAVAVVACPVQERYYARKCAESPTGQTAPESRLPLMMVNAVVLPVSLGIFAATSDPSTHWAGPLVAGVPFGFGLVGCYIAGNTYLVDVYSQYGASAMAAKTFARSMAGASVPLWIAYEYEHLGNRWAGAVFCFIAVGMAPIPFFFFKYGPAIRKRAKMATY